MKRKFLQLALVVALVSKMNTSSAQNLLTVNPGFEAGKKGWYFDNNNGSAVISEEAAKEGKAGIKITSIEGQGGKTIFTKPDEQKLVIEKDKKYQLDVWVKPVVKTRGIALKVYASTGFKASQDIEQEYSGKKLKMNEWQLISYEFVGKDYPNAKFSLAINLGEVYVDHFELYEKK